MPAAFKKLTMGRLTNASRRIRFNHPETSWEARKGSRLPLIFGRPLACLNLEELDNVLQLVCDYLDHFVRRPSSQQPHSCVSSSIWCADDNRRHGSSQTSTERIPRFNVHDGSMGCDGRDERSYCC